MASTVPKRGVSFEYDSMLKISESVIKTIAPGA